MSGRSITCIQEKDKMRIKKKETKDDLKMRVGTCIQVGGRTYEWEETREESIWY